MLLGIDHLVIAVHDPDASAAALEADLGIAFTGGGRHEAWGTFNRLAFLGDTYLELMGVFDRALVAASGTAVGRAALAVLDAGAEGLATFALATDDIAGDVARLQAAGSPIGAPVEGARTRPDGDTARWRTAAASLGPGEPPFLIEHADDGAEWDDAARAARAAFEHPSGGHVRLTQLELQCAEPSALAAACARTVGLVFQPSDDGLHVGVGHQVVRLSAAVGAPPTIDLQGDGWREPGEIVNVGIRWRCAS